jgi:hypothetical protein
MITSPRPGCSTPAWSRSSPRIPTLPHYVFNYLHSIQNRPHTAVQHRLCTASREHYLNGSVPLLSASAYTYIYASFVAQTPNGCSAVLGGL